MGQGTLPRFLAHLTQVIQKQQDFLSLFCQFSLMSLAAKQPVPEPQGRQQHSRLKYRLPLHGLASLRILIILAIGIGYASTMGIGSDSVEWGHHWGYDPSWYGIQMLFILSGFLAMRSMAQGRTLKGFFGSRLKSLWPALIAATLVSTCFIYPFMCAPDAPTKMSFGDLSLYFVKTIFLIDPGARMPGLLDDAKYACLLQGAIWTLRWGLILHVAFLFGWSARLLRHPKLVFTLCIASIAAYVGIVDFAVDNPDVSDQIKPIIPGLRLGYAYLIGVTLFHWQHVLRLNKRRILISAIVIGLLATAYQMWLPWSAAQELIGVSFWLTLCLGFLQNAPHFLRKCPRLAPVLYVSIWPAAQIVVALLPNTAQLGMMELSVALALVAAVIVFLLLRQARIQPARF